MSDRTEYSEQLKQYTASDVRELVEALREQRENYRFAQVRIELLLGRMRGCQELKGHDDHSLSLAEGKSWLKEMKFADIKAVAALDKFDAVKGDGQ